MNSLVRRWQSLSDERMDTISGHLVGVQLVLAAVILSLWKLVPVVLDALRQPMANTLGRYV